MHAAVLAAEERRLRHATLQEGLRALFDLALAAGDEERPGWAGMPADAAAQFVIGLHTVVADLHRGGRLERPWPREDVLDVLVGRVLPLLAPTTVMATDAGALVTLERPDHVPEDAPWERAAVSVLALLGTAVRPDLEVRGYVEPEGPGGRVVAELRFRARKP